MVFYSKLGDCLLNGDDKGFYEECERLFQAKKNNCSDDECNHQKDNSRYSRDCEMFEL